MTNQLRANESQRDILIELESALLSFCVSYKNHVLTDSTLILLGSQLCDEPESESLVDSLENVYNESQKAYCMLAQLSGQNTM